MKIGLITRTNMYYEEWRKKKTYSKPSIKVCLVRKCKGVSVSKIADATGLGVLGNDSLALLKRSFN